MFVCNTKLITCFSLILFLGFCNNRAKVVGTWRLSHKQGSNTVLSEYSSLWQGLCNQNRCQTGYSVQTLNCCTLTSFKEFLQGVRRQMVWVTNGSSALEFQLLDLLWSFAPKVKGKNDKFGKAKQLFISFAGQGVKKAFHVADQSKVGHCEFPVMGCIQASCCVGPNGIDFVRQKNSLLFLHWSSPLEYSASLILCTIVGTDPSAQKRVNWIATLDIFGGNHWPQFLLRL